MKACNLLTLEDLENENYGVYIGVFMLGLYWGYMGILEKKMETTGII